MRARALLFIPGLAAAALGICASGASGATLFTTTAHTAHVPVGVTADLTSTGSLSITNSGESVIATCPHSSLTVRVDQNSAGRVALTVTSGVVPPSCAGVLGQVTFTTTPAWLITLTGNGTVIGTQTAYAATVHNVAFDTALGLKYTGNLETGMTALQPTTGTSPICLVASGAGTVTSSNGPATIDGRYCFTGSAAAWSLTN